MTRTLLFLCISLLVAQSFAKTNPLGETVVRSQKVNKDNDNAFFTLVSDKDQYKVLVALYSSKTTLVKEKVEDTTQPTCRKMFNLKPEVPTTGQEETVKYSSAQFKTKQGDSATDLTLGKELWTSKTFRLASRCELDKSIEDLQFTGFLGLGKSAALSNVKTFGVRMPAEDNEQRIEVVVNPLTQDREKPTSTLDIEEDNTLNRINVKVESSDGFTGSHDRLNVIFDVNYNYIGAPQELYDIILKLVNHKSEKVKDYKLVGTKCGNPESECRKALPVITLSKKDDAAQKITITPSQYVITKDEDNAEFAIRPTTSDDEWKSRFNALILGRSYLKSNFVIFDVAGKKLNIHPEQSYDTIVKKRDERRKDAEKKERDEFERIEKEEARKKIEDAERKAFLEAERVLNRKNAEKNERENFEREEKMEGRRRVEEEERRQHDVEKDTQDFLNREKTNGKSNTGWIIALVVILVLAIVGGGGYYFYKRHKDSQAINDAYRIQQDETTRH